MYKSWRGNSPLRVKRHMESLGLAQWPQNMTVGKILALYAIYPGLIPGTPGGPSCPVRSEPRAQSQELSPKHSWVHPTNQKEMGNKKEHLVIVFTGYVCQWKRTGWLQTKSKNRTRTCCFFAFHSPQHHPINLAGPHSPSLCPRPHTTINHRKRYGDRPVSPVLPRT